MGTNLIMIVFGFFILAAGFVASNWGAIIVGLIVVVISDISALSKSRRNRW